MDEAQARTMLGMPYDDHYPVPRSLLIRAGLTETRDDSRYFVATTSRVRLARPYRPRPAGFTADGHECASLSVLHPKPSHNADLLHQPDQIVEEFLFDDFAVLPVRDGAELNMKLLLSRSDRLAVRPLHWTCHRATEIRNGAGPFALSNLNFIGMIDQMVVGKRLEKLDRLRLMIVDASRRVRLAWPGYNGVCGMPFFERFPVLRVP